MSSLSQPAIIPESAKEYKANQLASIPASVSLTCLVGSTIFLVAYYAYSMKLKFESIFLLIFGGVFLSYHIFEAQAKVEARYPLEIYAHSQYFGLTVDQWEKLLALLSVYGFLLLVNFCLCNVWRLTNECFQGCFFVLTVVSFQIHDSADRELSKVTIPLVVMGMSIAIITETYRRAQARKNEDAQQTHRGKPLTTQSLLRTTVRQFPPNIGTIVLCWLGVMFLRILEDEYMSEPQMHPGHDQPASAVEYNKTSIVRPFHHFFCLAGMLATLYTVQSFAAAKDRHVGLLKRRVQHQSAAVMGGEGVESTANDDEDAGSRKNQGGSSSSTTDARPESGARGGPSSSSKSIPLGASRSWQPGDASEGGTRAGHSHSTGVERAAATSTEFHDANEELDTKDDGALGEEGTVWASETRETGIVEGIPTANRTAWQATAPVERIEGS